MTDKPTITDAAFASAMAKTERLQRELDITNADHIAVWLESNLPEVSSEDFSLAWLACRIIDAHEQATAALRRQIANLEARGIHTCHADCDRPLCVAQRRIVELEGALRAVIDAPMIDHSDNSRSAKEIARAALTAVVE